MAKMIYRGFSTASQLERKDRSFGTSGIETVKRDLLNAIWTIKGERPMNPDFGTTIPMMAFEPLDEDTVSTIESQLRTVIAAEPRVQLDELVVLALPDNNAIVAIIDLTYLRLNLTETMRLEFPIGS